jgi:hypothetical protein
MVTEAASSSIPPRLESRFALPLLRLVQSSFNLRKALLAALGLIILHAGWDLSEFALPGTRSVSPSLPGRSAMSVATAGELEEHADWEQVRNAGWRMTEPVRILASPLISMVEPGKGLWIALRALISAIWVIVVWGFFGGAIARMSVDSGTSQSGAGLANSIRFAWRSVLPLVVTPLCPLLAIGLCALLCALVGLAYWLPDPIGTIVGGILLFIPLSLGFVMVLLLLGLLAGWPLFHASIAADAPDVLDALSRCFSYIKQRLGRFALCVALAWAAGVPALVGVELLASGVIHLATWGLSFSAPASSITPLGEGVPLGTAFVVATTAFPAFWRSAVGLLAQGWIYAYFWTAAAHIYLLLRRDVDGALRTDICDAS